MLEEMDLTYFMRRLYRTYTILVRQTGWQYTFASGAPPKGINSASDPHSQVNSYIPPYSILLVTTCRRTRAVPSSSPSPPTSSAASRPSSSLRLPPTTTRMRFNTAFDGFFSHDLKDAVFNGKKLSREKFKEQIRAASNANNTVSFGGIVSVPSSSANTNVSVRAVRFMYRFDVDFAVF